MTTTGAGQGERADLLESLARHRYFLRVTVRGITDEQARLRPTPSELCLGGLVKHVTASESAWFDFLVRGPVAMAPGEDGADSWPSQFHMQPGETLEDVLARYEQVARRTDELVADLPDLDAAQPLPEAPWFEPGATWSARRVLLHILAETAQHAGHADIIREAIDGSKTMG